MDAENFTKLMSKEDAFNGDAYAYADFAMGDGTC
jgi:hypothetical protein